MKPIFSVVNKITIFIELSVTVLGCVSVIAYNGMFNTSISPVLGILAGAANGMFVVWCIKAPGQTSHELSETKI